MQRERIHEKEISEKKVVRTTENRHRKMVNETLESNHTSLYIWCKSVENTNAKQGREE